MAGTVIHAAENAEPDQTAVVSPGNEQSSVGEPMVVDHVVYLAKLPSPDELLRGAELKATPIIRMDQTADRIVVVYQYAGGRTVTFAYTLLASASASPVSVSQPASSATYTVVTPTPAPPVTATVVYVQSEPVYYAPRVRYYNSAWDSWAPFAVGFGFGWVGGRNYDHCGYGYGYGHGRGGYGGGYGHGGGHGHR